MRVGSIVPSRMHESWLLYQTAGWLYVCRKRGGGRVHDAALMMQGIEVFVRRMIVRIGLCPCPLGAGYRSGEHMSKCYSHAG